MPSSLATWSFRFLALLLSLLSLIAMDITLVPASDAYVPKPLDTHKLASERRRRALKQKLAAAEQAVEVEKALYRLDGALEGVRLNPKAAEVVRRLSELRSKVGDAVGERNEVVKEEEEEEEVEEAGEGEEEVVVVKRIMVPVVLARSEAVVPVRARLLVENPEEDPGRWAVVRVGETAMAMKLEVEGWIAQGKTKKLGFDVFWDPLEGTSQLLRQKGKANGMETKESETLPPKAQPGDAQRRFVHRTKPVVPLAMTTFLQQLRGTRTYSHMSKAIDTDRKLKALGYKQSTGGGKVKALFQGMHGETCPHFDEKQVSFCNFFLPTYREQDQQALLQMHERVVKKDIPGLEVEQFFPATWRLYKQLDRRGLRTRTQNESLPSEGGPYVSKFTFSHGAGKPSLTVKMFNQLRKSDESQRQQTQEAKQKMIVQVYCNNPYMFESKKFIIRTWAVIISNNPMMVLYHDGAILRSVVPYSPFTKRDAHYKRAAHFTNDQSTHKGVLRSSSLYASLGQFQHWLNTQHKESPTYVRDFLRPKMKARMIYALYAMMKPSPRTKADDMDEDESGGGEFGGDAAGSDSGADVVKKMPKLPSDVAIVQPVCFDFLLQEGGQSLWLLGAHASGACSVNVGGDSFKPPWKVSMQTALSDRLVELGEEMLWRRVANVKLDSMSDLVTDVQMDVLIDETLPGWSYVEETNWYLSGGYVEGGLGSRDVIEAIDETHDSEEKSNGENLNNGGGGNGEDGGGNGEDGDSKGDEGEDNGDEDMGAEGDD